MSRDRRLAILVVVIALGAVVYYVALRPISLEGVVDHKTITGAREGTSYSIVVFTSAGNHFDDKEVRGLFDETNLVNDTVAYQLEARYDEVFYIVSVRSGEETMGFFTSRQDFNEVVPGSSIRFKVQGPGGLEISIIRVLD
jgi:hypothetical protein